MRDRMFPTLLGVILGISPSARSRVRCTATRPCDAKSWPGVQAQLDRVPVFTVTRSDGQPLPYDVGGKQQIAVFYTDVEAGKKELSNVHVNFPDLGCDLTSVGLGIAYKACSDGKALIVPGVADLCAAGAPEDVRPVGQEVPLFACMSMQRKEKGGSKVPLFLNHADCVDSLVHETDGLDIDAVFSLQSIVEELTELEDPSTGAFTFEPPATSLQHAQSYIGQGVYIRPVENTDD